MSAAVVIPMVPTELGAECLPLPESRPNSPTNIEEPAATALATSAQTEVISSVTVQTHGAAKDVEPAADADGSETNRHVTDVNANSPANGPKVEVDAATIDGAATKTSDPEQSVGPADPKHMDPNDTENNGNVSKTFFTSELRSNSSPVYEQGRISLKFSELSDLFVKTTDANGRVYIFEVHSATLEAASTVFYNMIYTSNTRGNKEVWIWELQDSVIGLKVMFSLLHLNYRAALFSRDPNSHQVYEVLRVLAKYGIRDEAFHPFVKSWVAGFRNGLDKTQLTHLERLYTSHKLGDFKTLKGSIRKVAHDVEVDEDGSMLLDKKPIQEVVPITDELVTNVRAVRTEDLKDILEPLIIAYETLMGDANDHELADFCRSTDGHDECNEKLLGSLLGNLRRQKLRPLPTPSTYTGSVGALAVKVSQMDIRGLIVPNLEPHKQRHGRCKLGQDDVARHLLECKAYVPIYDDLVEQIVVTIKRVGTNKTDKDDFMDYMDVFNEACTKYDEGFLHDDWGWDDDVKSEGSMSLSPTEDSSFAEDSDSKEGKGSPDLTISANSAT
ncbi:hypothetical protein N0V82_008809 [Gnomoniopsis sp. IMI 355080]|nr:hypothetical protein N0V82_008809 [Gnomoniopsis sp. IMI 355080]